MENKKETICNYFCFHRKRKQWQLNLGGRQVLLGDSLEYLNRAFPDFVWEVAWGVEGDPTALDKS